ncbi:hypothetical protein HYH03_006018 [Edaphochlamys debaryana]|uniref:Peptidase M11 gametolysin domain-containing protein n=1 Tax=Edaphochlamys debaryana TaxID=47281 RepID=A0A835Y6S2_9CHLO|nr:hypothetical protein HYH03_006018 [Edaphochlamys debaryana]|eukprot:KAG2495773.1 hypothetical protein HYH03_006018 [Edaphochlamys debaryana]
MCSYGKVVANGFETYIMGPIQIGLGEWMNTTMRRRIVTVLPKEVTCGWAGLGSVGCGGRACTVYIKGGYGLTLTVQMHELGHTQGLSHAGRGLDEYGDRGDVLGSTGGADGYLCMNPGNQLRLGWNTPIGYLRPLTVNDAPTNTGQRGIWRLPNMASTDVNHVYINMTVPGFPYANHFASFRARTPTYDAILSSDYNNRVHIHQFNGTTNDRDYNRTLLMALLGPGQWYMSRFVSYGAGTAAGGALNFSVISIDSGREAIGLTAASRPLVTAPAPALAAAASSPAAPYPLPASTAFAPLAPAATQEPPARSLPALPAAAASVSSPSPVTPTAGPSLASAAASPAPTDPLPTSTAFASLPAAAA